MFLNFFHVFIRTVLLSCSFSILRISHASHLVVPELVTKVVFFPEPCWVFTRIDSLFHLEALGTDCVFFFLSLKTKENITIVMCCPRRTCQEYTVLFKKEKERKQPQPRGEREVPAGPGAQAGAAERAGRRLFSPLTACVFE